MSFKPPCGALGRFVWAMAHMGQGPHGPWLQLARAHMGQSPHGPGRPQEEMSSCGARRYVLLRRKRTCLLVVVTMWSALGLGCRLPPLSPTSGCARVLSLKYDKYSAAHVPSEDYGPRAGGNLSFGTLFVILTFIHSLLTTRLVLEAWGPAAWRPGGSFNHLRTQL